MTVKSLLQKFQLASTIQEIWMMESISEVSGVLKKNDIRYQSADYCRFVNRNVNSFQIADDKLFVYMK